MPPVVRSGSIQDHTQHIVIDETMRRRSLCTCTYSGYCERLQRRTRPYLQERERDKEREVRKMLEKRASSSGFLLLSGRDRKGASGKKQRDS